MKLSSQEFQEDARSQSQDAQNHGKSLRASGETRTLEEFHPLGIFECWRLFSLSFATRVCGGLRHLCFPSLEAGAHCWGAEWESRAQSAAEHDVSAATHAREALCSAGDVYRPQGRGLAKGERATRVQSSDNYRVRCFFSGSSYCMLQAAWSPRLVLRCRDLLGVLSCEVSPFAIVTWHSNNHKWFGETSFSGPGVGCCNKILCRAAQQCSAQN
eukprot:10627-Amphidinium_carterae.1